MLSKNFSLFSFRLLVIGTPMVFQSLLFGSLGFVDNIMVGQLGTNEITASGVSARFFLLFITIISGIGAGICIMLSQYWGALDKAGFQRNLALGMVITSLLSFITSLICIIYPEFISFLFSLPIESEIITVKYLPWLGIAILLSGPIVTLNAAIRSTGKTYINLCAVTVEVFINIILNYLLIFGYAGLPELGIIGAGIGTAIARTTHFVFLLLCTYKFFPLIRFNINIILNSLNYTHLITFKRITLPILFSSIIWSFGMFTFQVLLGRLGSNELITISILLPLEGLFLAFSGGFSNAISITIGNKLGAGEFFLSKIYSRYAIIISLSLSLFMACSLLLLFPLIINFYSNLDRDVLKLINDTFPVVVLGILFKSINITLLVGILRAGGDNEFCLRLDTFCQWGLAIPLTALSIVFLNIYLPLAMVIVLIEEFIKTPIALRRVFGNYWVNNLTVNHNETA